jgi:hypothetical protein
LRHAAVRSATFSDRCEHHYAPLIDIVNEN